MPFSARLRQIDARHLRDPAILLVVTMVALAAAGWLMRHAYWGIVHDNQLYAVQALRYNNPDIFNGDLFFRYGSQDSFTLFSPLYGTLIDLLGLNAATIALVVIGQVLWIAAAVSLVRVTIPKPFQVLAVVIVATYGHVYGGNFVFSIGEGFVTPRLFSEAFCLGATAAFLSSRYLLTAVLFILAMILHPLMAVPPAAAIILLALFRGRPWWTPIALVGSVTVLLVLTLAVVRFAGLPFPAMIDPEWKYIAGTRSMQLLIAKWGAADWLSLLVDLLVVGVACVVATPVLRQLFATVIGIVVASIVLSFVGFDLLDNLLIGQLQIWRAAWFLRALAPIAMTLIMYDVCVRNTPRKHLLLALCGLVCILVATAASAGIPSLGLPCALLLAIVFADDRRNRVDPMFTRVLGLFTAISAAAVISGAVVMIYRLYKAANRAQDPVLAGFTLRDYVQLFIPAVALCAGFFVFSRGRGSVATAIFAVALLILSMSSWDQRTDWRRYMDSAPDINSELVRPIAPSEVVYWPGNIMGVWGALHRQSYYSAIQGAGSIFNRQTAIEFLRLLRTVNAFEPGAEWATEFLGTAAPLQEGTDISSRRLFKQDLVALCRQVNPPDVIFLTQLVDGVPHEVWKPKVGRPYSVLIKQPRKSQRYEARYVHSFYVYRCADVFPGQAADRGSSGHGARLAWSFTP